ncbi:PREDICTED: forkhead box protein N3-like isoform X2 [Nicrophorus vespilloides]|uniref:Forkhead box protein N3-like isoform X2 n=1 Tax=Nicrophorus vespilloides TaxID=110193 RepID=A0ABM1NKK3_NICVS|nr:PREDICTED: forkhead box protein N3-like isoform X2 [Nicrophorus vespilloides]
MRDSSLRVYVHAGMRAAPVVYTHSVAAVAMTTLCTSGRGHVPYQSKDTTTTAIILPTVSEWQKFISMSPERAVSPQEEKVMTPKMSVPGSPVAGTPARDDQSAFTILLAVAQSQSSKASDDDLTSLSWLQNKDLLKDQSPTSDYVDDSSISAADSSSSSLNSPIPLTPQPPNKQQARYRHPHTIPYDPMVHVTNKPPYSFSCLIFMAIEDSYQKALPVKEIYAWIMDHFPYFKTAPTGWKNSVRHNLSLNKCFQKVEKAPNLGKGSLWTVDQQYRPNLLQALTRSPFHPCSTLDPSDYYKSKPSEKLNATTNSNSNSNSNNNNNGSSNNNSNSNASSRLPNAELFPFLSTEMSRWVKTETTDADSLDAVDAATVMLSLRDGPRHRMKKNMVITTSPSQDHTYSAANQNGSIDEAFESEDERVPNTRRKIDFEDEEDRRIKEGADALLNLAGIHTRKRTNSECNSANGKRIKTNGEEKPEKSSQFRPRMLRKKKETRRPTNTSNNNNNNSSSHNNNNNNNNNSFLQTDGDWAKRRKDVIEPKQSR